MTPQDVAAFTALASLVKEIGTWPLGTIMVLVTLGPWIGMLLITYIQGKRHAAVVKMYEDNVVLVKTTQSLALGMQDIVVLSTQTMTQVKSAVEANLYCPLMRKNPKVEKEVPQ